MNEELRGQFERTIKMSLTNEDDLEFWMSAFETYRSLIKERDL
jgi:hypothetical protein